MSWSTAAVRSVLRGRLTKAASLSSATLCLTNISGYLDWGCAIEMISAAVGEVMEPVYSRAQERLSDAGDQGGEGKRRWLGGVRELTIISSRYMLSPSFMRWSFLEWMLMGCLRRIL